MLLCSALVAVLSAQAVPATRVQIGLHVVAMRNINNRAQSFDADLYVWLRFRTDDEKRAAEIIEHLEPMNGTFASKDEVDRKQVNGEWYACYRVTGTFYFKQNLRLYPFDTQTLELVFENSQLPLAEMVFVDDTDSYRRSKTPETRWGINPELSIPEYTLRDVKRHTAEMEYPTNFGDPDRLETGATYSRFVIEVSFVREYLSYAFKILIPLLIILAMAYLVFFLPPSQLDTNAAVSVTALLSCMAYNVAVSQNMPDIGYLVMSDKFFIATYTLLLLTLAETFVSFVMFDRGNEVGALKLERRARFVFPVMVALIFVWLGVDAVLTTGHA